MTAAVVEHACGAVVYALADPDGVTRLLETVESRFGLWLPCPDGRTCRRISDAEARTRRYGHRLHECVPEEQVSLW